MSVIINKGRSVVAWLRGLPRGLQTALGVFAAAVVLVLALGSYQAYDYTQNNPQFCRTCHVMEKAWDRWSTSEHRTIDCHKCHEQSVQASMEQLVKFALERPEEVSKHAEVPHEACARCHESGSPRWLQVAQTAGHEVHAGQQKVECVTCHSTSLHRFVPAQEVCSQCHQEKSIKVASMAAQHCTTCHNYLREAEELRPEREECLNCHLAQAQKPGASNPKLAQVTWPEVAPMKWKCSACHQPHQTAEPVVQCLSCHGERKGKHKVDTHAKLECQTCHRPHEWKAPAREACQSCHADKVQHNPGPACANCHSFKS